MTNLAKVAIMQRLRAAAPSRDFAPSDFSIMDEVSAQLDEGDKIAQFRQITEAVNTEVYEVDRTELASHLQNLLRQKDTKTLLKGQVPALGALVAEADCEVIAYDQDYESLKDTIFNVDASLTTSLGAIAQTGTVVLWPTVEEPRLLSLVPPLHIVLVEESQLFASFHQMMAAQNWADAMPTNALLISGPSKTADIEQELCYGVHGPKQFVVYIIKSPKEGA